MSVGNVAQAIGTMHEQVRPELPIFYQQAKSTWNFIEERTDITVVSSRPTRVPARLLAGGKFRQGNPDNADIGRGSAPVTDAFALVPVYFFQASEYSKAAEINTNSDEKAIEDYAKLTMQDATEQFNVNMDGVFAGGDGSNTLDSVVALSNGNTTITVNNANAFTDNMDIDIWTALGGVFLGTATILSVDGPNKQINLTAAAPGGTAAGNLLLVSGSAGIANSGLFGIPYFNLSSNTGSLMNLSRPTYPGKLSAQHVAGGGLALTPAIARRSLAQIQIAMGDDAAEKAQLIYHMNVDMIAAWENVHLGVMVVNQQDVKGDTSIDMLKRSTPKTFANRPVKISIKAKYGRIDGLALKHWFRVENQKMDYYEVGGQTLFPTYGPSGGINTSTLFYLWTGVQVGNELVRMGVFIDGLAPVTGY